MPQLAEKTTLVLELLLEHGHVVRSTSMRVLSKNRKTLADLVNEWRKRRHVNVFLHRPNLTTYLKHPDRRPVGFMNEITGALGLDELGFDETLWRHSPDAIVEMIRAALDGGVTGRVLKHPVEPHLFALDAPVPKGIKFPGEDADVHRFHLLNEISVEAGTTLGTRAVMPFKGHLRVIALENGEFIGLNHLLGVPETLDIGKHQLEDFETSVQVARTIIFAFASTEPRFARWPVRHDKMARLAPGAFQSLVDNFYTIDASERASNVQSFVTTMPQRG